MSPLARDFVSARGAQAGEYLQGQLSQDVSSLADGGSAWAWLLSPAGKVDALLRVTRLAAEDWLLDTDPGWGERVVDRLERFRLRTKVELAPLAWEALRVWSPAPPAAHAAVLGSPAVEVAGWPRAGWRDVVGLELRTPLDAAAVGPDEAEAMRIAAGMPRMGAELDERTIPAETGAVAWTVSFTKGCYTGQELVARIDSRGSNVARRLCVFDAAEKVEAGTSLASGAAAAGVVTSVAPAPNGGWIGLAYVRRAFAPPVTLAAGEGGPQLRVLEPLA